MGRYKQAPDNFECPYRHSCPHMDGVSATWALTVFHEADIERNEHWGIREMMAAEIDALHACVAQQEEKIALLEAQKKALHQRQFKSAKTRPSPGRPGRSASKSNTDAPPKKRGAPKGHPYWRRRKPNHVDKTTPVAAPEICPHCGCEHLDPSDEIKDHLQEDIVLQPRTFVINFKHRQAYCPRCDRLVVQTAEGELPNCDIGPATKAAASFLRYGMRLSYRKVQELFDVLFGMPLAHASAMNFDRTATKRGEPLYEDLKEKLRASAVVHADETHWRQDGRNMYMWYGGNENLGVFHIDPSRSSEAAVKLLGDDFGGALGTDGYAAYNAVNAKKRQSCLAHLIRKAEEIEKEIMLLPLKHRDPRAIRFCRSIAGAFAKACEMGRKLDAGELSYKAGALLVRRFYCLIHTICSSPLTHKSAESFRLRILDPKREYNRLFTFLTVPGLAATNNHAERALRSPVIFRKICFGTRSAEGSRSHSVLPSLLLTARRQDQHPLEFFRTLLTADTASAQAALFNDSS